MAVRQRLGNALKNRAAVALALLLAAVILPFCVLHYDHYTLTFPRDDAVRAPQPVWLLRRDTVTNEFVGECGGRVVTCGMQTVEGYFGRSFVSPGMALLGGLVLPQMLLLACFAYAAGRRWTLMLALCLAALVLVFDLVHFAAVTGTETHFGYFPDDRLPRAIAILLGFGVPAALVLAALGLGVDGARRHWLERRRPILVATPMR